MAIYVKCGLPITILDQSNYFDGIEFILAKLENAVRETLLCYAYLSNYILIYLIRRILCNPGEFCGSCR